MKTALTALLFCLLPLLKGLALPDDLGNPASSSEHVTVQLGSAHRTLQPGQPTTLALRLRMAEGWHTYWLNPGETGMATTIRLDLPEGYMLTAWAWPTPHRLDSAGLISYAYEGEILLTATLIPPAQTTLTQLDLKASVNWLECEAICQPGSATLSLTLPIVEDAPEPHPEWAEAIAAQRSTLPQPLPPTFPIEARAEGPSRLTLLLPEGTAAVPRYFFDLETLVDPAAPQTVGQTGSRPTLTLQRSAYATPGDTLQGVLTLEDGRAYVLQLPLTATDPASPRADKALVLLLVFGLLGGLVLNLMPCVFPVIGIKIMGFVRQAGQQRRSILLHGLVYTAGVLVSMWLLAGLLLALRATGQELGWGFQLQNPAFVYSLSVFLLLFALNMSGLFEIGTSAIGIGGQLAEKKGYGGSFFSGILATIVATPCAAPFLSTALGTALTLPPTEALLVFTAIGMGLSLPYLLLTLLPQALKHLPRPGAWMESFKQAMAFLLYGTVAFLLWTLIGLTSQEQQFNALFSLVAIALGAWIYGRWDTPARPNPTRWKARLVTALLLIGATVWGWPQDDQKLSWQPWSLQEQERLIAEERIVYVDFTARWCATCQLNKRVALNNERVQERLRDLRVATLVADWTAQDESITRELAKYGRSAVPFNLLHVPGRPPILLPELLTPDIVLDALEEAATP